ncbi:hypothetical protein G3578_09485 [Brevibacillus sp. SYP-B805]|uniref:hypothetical protein n=1 Tax=Brevibacillus sp. SYP-B805 TaxID=1578199 RepID=UPI0013EC00DC|nr:hypothetical protein [Brevibacillus sp. SYP-B805]NGQ95387.1 hypothetical protein [Brevibacillus sp. SYP-B805]
MGSSIGIPGLILLSVLALFAIVVVLAIASVRRGWSGKREQERLAEIEKRLQRLEEKEKERS